MAPDTAGLAATVAGSDTVTWYYRAHSVKNLRRNILAFCGIEPARTTLVGMVEGMTGRQRDDWLEKLRKLGREAR